MQSVRDSQGMRWRNVEIMPPTTASKVLLPGVSHTGIQAWGLNHFTPAPQARAVASGPELPGALKAAYEARPYVIQTGNFSLQSAAAPVAVQSTGPVYWQGHPLRSLSVDFAGRAGLVQVGQSTSLVLRNLTLYNTGIEAVRRGATAHPLQAFGIGLWAFSLPR